MCASSSTWLATGSSRSTSSAWRARCLSASRDGKISTRCASAGGLALLAGDQGGDVVGLGEQQVAQPEQQSAALREGQRAPRGERVPRRRHGRRGLLGVEEAHLGERLRRSAGLTAAAHAARAPRPRGSRSRSDGSGQDRRRCLGYRHGQRPHSTSSPANREAGCYNGRMERRALTLRTANDALLPRARDPRHRGHGAALAARGLGALRPSRAGTCSSAGPRSGSPGSRSSPSTRWIRVTPTSVDMPGLRGHRHRGLLGEHHGHQRRRRGRGRGPGHQRLSADAGEGWRMINHHASPAPVQVTQPFSGTVQ